MKKLATAIFIAMLLLLIQGVNPSLARQGCCSHHGGVCGCHCCDGSPLSAKCAPYYPSCNKASTYSAPPKEEKKWYQSGWTYVIGGLGLWMGGAWIKEKIDERRKRKEEEKNHE